MSLNGMSKRLDDLAERIEAEIEATRREMLRREWADFTDDELEALISIGDKPPEEWTPAQQAAYEKMKDRGIDQLWP